MKMLLRWSIFVHAAILIFPFVVARAQHDHVPHVMFILTQESHISLYEIIPVSFNIIFKLKWVLLPLFVFGSLSIILGALVSYFMGPHAYDAEDRTILATIERTLSRTAHLRETYLNPLRSTYRPTSRPHGAIYLNGRSDFHIDRYICIVVGRRHYIYILAFSIVYYAQVSSSHWAIALLCSLFRMKRETSRGVQHIWTDPTPL
jgi:hypothetical protein